MIFFLPPFTTDRSHHEMNESEKESPAQAQAPAVVSEEAAAAESLAGTAGNSNGASMLETGVNEVTIQSSSNGNEDTQMLQDESSKVCLKMHSSV